MLPTQHRRLADILRQGLGLNKARADGLVAAVSTAIDNASVLLADIADHLPGKAKAPSKFHRVQDFFREVDFDYGAIARLLLGMVRPYTQEPLYLALDRTNWENRQHDVNLLVLSVCMGDVGLPILWTDLRHPGNSDTEKRIRLLSRFLRDCPGRVLACLVGDREFIGEHWFAWLKGQGIPFVIWNQRACSAAARWSVYWRCCPWRWPGATRVGAGVSECRVRSG